MPGHVSCGVGVLGQQMDTISEHVITAPTDEFCDEQHTEEPSRQFISFRLGTEWYGVPLTNVREVVRAGQITYLPSAPAPIAGVINLRGNIVSVTDPKRVFDLPQTSVSDQGRIVVVETRDSETGLLVDEVGEVVTVPVSGLEPPLATLDLAQAGLIEHTYRWKDRLVAILKAEKLLTSVADAQGERSP